MISLIWFILKHINFVLVLTVFANIFSLFFLRKMILFDNTPTGWLVAEGIANTLLFIVPIIIGVGLLLLVEIFSFKITYIERTYVYLRQIIGFIVYFFGVYMVLARAYNNYEKSVFKYSFDGKVYFWGQLFIMVFFGIILFDWLGKKLRDKCETLLS